MIRKGLSNLSQINVFTVHIVDFWRNTWLVENCYGLWSFRLKV